MKREPFTVYLDHEVLWHLHRCSELTHVRMADIVREILTVEALRDWARGRGIGGSSRLCSANGEVELEASEPLPELT